MTLEAFSPLDQPIGKPSAIANLAVAGGNLGELPDSGAVMCSAAVDGSEIIGRLSAMIGCPLPEAHGAIGAASGRQAIWMTPRSWLILCPPAEEHDIIAGVETAYPDHLVHAAPFSDYLAWFSLAGSRSETALRQGSFLSLSSDGFKIGHAKRTPLAGVPAIIIRDSADNWRIGVERSRADFILRWFKSLTAS